MELTCKSQLDNTQLEEGEEPPLGHGKKHEQIVAYKKCFRKKEEIINAGLKRAYWEADKPRVKLEFVAISEHDVKEGSGHCKYCRDKVPLQDNHCKWRAEHLTKRWDIGWK